MPFAALSSSSVMTALTVLSVAIALAAVFVAVPALILGVVCVASVFLPPARLASRPAGVALAVLIPAHDEQENVGATVLGVRSQLAPGDRVLVVADNCSDETAERARAAGAEVIERVDTARRGKGYALAFGSDHLAQQPPDVVIIVDADCHLTPGAIDALVQTATATQRPAQADYVLQPTDNTAIAMISALAMLVRNRVRSRGWCRLGLPCHLAGTGMAFPWHVLRAAPALGANLVEDLVLGCELALQCHQPILCAAAGVRSELPAGRGAVMQQRRRWEHGQLGTLLVYGPRLLKAGVRRGDAGLLALGADLIVPPLALLVSLLALILLAAGLVAASGGPLFPAVIAGGALILVVLGVATGWARYGARAIPLRYLLLAPIYVIWKLPLYVAFLLGRRERRWLRTRRSRRP
jgi:cellulose synthase/poly-beta-1,6-N-acetylglucosamine synthase-like glycosyltransferase